MSDGGKQADELRAAIAGLEAQRSLLGDAVVDPALAALRQQLLELDTSQANLGAAATSVWRSTVVSGAGDATGIALVQVYEMGFE